MKEEKFQSKQLKMAKMLEKELPKELSASGILRIGVGSDI